MKKLFFITVCLGFLWSAQTNAQENILFPLISKGSGKAVTLVGDELLLREKQTQENKIAQLFFFKRQGDAKVIIVSAANNSLCLKRTGNGVALKTFRASDVLHFLWEICYAGHPYCTIKHPDASRMVLKVEGDKLVMDRRTTLSSNEDPNGDAYRFTFGKKQNLSLKSEENVY